MDADTASLDIKIRNVVCVFHVKCHLNLRHLANNGSNVEYIRDKGMLLMKVRKPSVTATIRSSGAISVTGSTSEDEAKIAARRVARILQRLGFKVRFTDFRVVNTLGTCSLPFGVHVDNFCAKNRQARYEPELHPGVKLKVIEHGAEVTIFQTGSMTITAPTVQAINMAVHHVWPLVHEFRRELMQGDQPQVISP